MALIETKQVSKQYTDGEQTLHVLQNIDLTIERGTFTALVGPSGAGKSTLLHLLGWLDQPSSGQVIFDGLSYKKATAKQRALVRNQHIGFVFQFFHLLPELTAFENVTLPAMIQGWRGAMLQTSFATREKLRGKKPLHRKAEELLDFVGLSDRVKHRPNQLSGGEQQRVAIARALLNDPDVLLCDEPTGNLDSENGERIIQLLQDVRRDRKTTLVLVTHDASLAGLADRVVRIRDGRLLEASES